MKIHQKLKSWLPIKNLSLLEFRETETQQEKGDDKDDGDNENKYPPKVTSLATLAIHKIPPFVIFKGPF